MTAPCAYSKFRMWDSFEYLRHDRFLLPWYIPKCIKWTTRVPIYLARWKSHQNHPSVQPLDVHEGYWHVKLTKQEILYWVRICALTIFVFHTLAACKANSWPCNKVKKMLTVKIQLRKIKLVNLRSVSSCRVCMWKFPECAVHLS